MLRSALRPRWVIGTVLVVAVVVAMANLGFWQLRRHDERQAFNERLEERTAEVIPFERAPADTDEAELRRVRATGVYEPDGEVLLRFRSRNGLPGHHVLTPLRLADGSAVVVNRGWVPLEMGERWPVRSAAPPAGTVEIEALVRRGDGDGRFRPTSGPGGTRLVGSVDLVALDGFVAGPLRPVYLQRLDPDDERFPIALPAPVPDDGPHLSYAFQWFSFAAVAAIGWVLLLRSHVRGGPRRGDERDPAADDDAGDGDEPGRVEPRGAGPASPAATA